MINADWRVVGSFDRYLAPGTFPEVEDGGTIAGRASTTTGTEKRRIESDTKRNQAEQG